MKGNDHPALAEIDAPRLEALFEEAVQLHQSGLLGPAEAIYRRILAADPLHADSLHLLGLLSHQVGDAARAVAQIGLAIELRPQAAHYRCNMGNALRALGRAADALAQLDEAARLRPDLPEIAVNRGSVLMDLDRPEDAAACHRAALRLRPDLADAHYNLGNALARLGQPAEAVGSYAEALRLRPDFPDALANLGAAQMACGRLAEAVACYRAVLRARPDLPGAHNNLGVALQRLDHLAEAETCYADALRLAPDDASTHYNLGCVHLAQNRLEHAAECYRQALRLDPGHGPARFGLLRAQLPILYGDEAQIAERRAAYAAGLHELAEDAARPDAASRLAAGAVASPPFFLAYGGGDDRALQAAHGALVSGLLAGANPPASLPPPPAPGERIRVGIVSGFFSRHTVWTLMLQGWLRGLDRRRFAMSGYHTGPRQDDATAEAAGLCDRFVTAPPGGDWRAAILADRPHVLLYPEIGMDPVSAGLAAQRLARVQCVSWGHPVTTGLPTMDHYLSSDAMEPADGAAHYTETLVRLPGLGTCYEPCDRPALALTREELGLRPGAMAYWSGQSLPKYLPQHDAVFPRIAQAVGDCQFVFIGFGRSRAVTDLFRARLGRAFAAHGLDADRHCVILPSLAHDRFLAAIGLCDAVLDTIGWSGGKSTLEALTWDPAVVTLPGPLMRSRHTAAMLELMGVRDTIAADLDDYVALAARLAHDPAWRADVRRRVAAAKGRLHRDPAPIAALEDFLDAAVRGTGGNQLVCRGAPP